MTHCPRCQTDLEKLDTGFGEQLRDSPLQEGLFADHPEVELDNLVSCPLCSQTMRRLNYCGDSGILIDSCPDGHGIWLDDGELARIFDYTQS